MPIYQDVLKHIAKNTSATKDEIIEATGFASDQIRDGIRYCQKFGYITSELEDGEPLYKLTAKGKELGLVQDKPADTVAQTDATASNAVQQVEPAPQPATKALAEEPAKVADVDGFAQTVTLQYDPKEVRFTQAIDQSVKVYPTEFEAYDDCTAIFKVKAVDEACADVDIKSPMTVELWDEIAPKIRQCLVDMSLGG